MGLKNFMSDYGFINGGLPKKQLYRIPVYANLIRNDNISQDPICQHGILDIGLDVNDSFSRRNIGDSILTDKLYKVQFQCDDLSNWYLLSPGEKPHFITNIMFVSVIRILTESSGTPTAFSLDYTVSGQRMHCNLSFEQFVSNSLFKLFYLPERSSSISNTIVNDLLRYCISVSYKTKMFLVPRFMGWVFSNINDKMSCYFASNDNMDPSLLSFCPDGVKCRSIRPNNDIYLTKQMSLNSLSLDESFIVLIRSSSLLLSWFIRKQILPDSIFITENRIIADILNNSCCDLVSVSGKDAKERLDFILDNTNDGIALINALEYSEKELHLLSGKLKNDMAKMRQYPRSTVHISIVLTDSHLSFVNDDAFCPLVINDDEISKNVIDFKDKLTALEYKIIDLFQSHYDQENNKLENIYKDLHGENVGFSSAQRYSLIFILLVTYNYLSQSGLVFFPPEFKQEYIIPLLCKRVNTIDTLQLIADEFAEKLNSLIAEKQLKVIDRKDPNIIEYSHCSIIVNKDKLYLDHTVINNLIKPGMKLTKEHSVLFQALDSTGYLYKTNGYQSPLDLIDQNGKIQLLRTYCFYSKILSDENFKYIFAPFNTENQCFFLDRQTQIPSDFLPLVSNSTGLVSGRVIRKEDEENNHILITGLGGYGKSYALCRIAAHLATLGHKVIAFDSTGSFSKAKIEKIFPSDYVKDHISFHDISSDKLPVDIFHLSDDDMGVDIIADILAAGTKDLPSLQLEKLKGLISKVKEKGNVSAGTVLSALKAPDSAKPLRNRMEPLLNTLSKYHSDEKNDTWREFFADHHNFIIVSVPVVYSKERNPLFDVLLASLFNYQQTATEQPLDFLVDELQKENISADSPLDQIIAVGRNYRMSVIAATQHYKLSGRLKTIAGNIDTKIFLKPTADSEAAVLKYLNIPGLKSEYLKGMLRGDCIVFGKLYDQMIDMNRHGVVLGRILDYQLNPTSGSDYLHENTDDLD